MKATSNNLRPWQQLHLQKRFFYAFAACILLFVLAYVWPLLMVLAWVVMTAFWMAVLLDIALLYAMPLHLQATRHCARRFSLGDENRVDIEINFNGRIPLSMIIIDEMPEQFQIRDQSFECKLQPGESYRFSYLLMPKKRGEYFFGKINAMVSTKLGLAMRRQQLAEERMVPVYPSVIQMKKYELMAFQRISTLTGIKKVRRLGHSYEFEKIRQYALGDDMRSVNWKATSRRNTLMVNQYEDERSQQILFVIDKSRIMLMPFNGMSLLDYAINSTLVLCNIALQKFDKVGLLSFADKLGTVVKCDSGPAQLTKMLQGLYAERSHTTESNFDVLYRATHRVVSNRSLLFVYTNFESEYALLRALPALQRLNRLHLLVVVIFENSELKDYAKGKVSFVSDIYSQTIANKLLHDKRAIAARLQKAGIQTVLSTPEDLSIQSINKYLELKAKGLI
jgi:uncharacterized protein (DUF58 family)